MSQPLVLALHTLPSAPLSEQFAAAARNGFGGVAFWTSQVEQDLAAGVTLGEIRASAHDHGLEVSQLEVAGEWAKAGSDRRAGDAEADRLVEMADALGARALLAAALWPGALALDAAAEGFARLCDRAAGSGIEVNLEFLPWSGIATVEAAHELVCRADRANGGLLVDTWHWFRSGGTLAALGALPPRVVQAVQLNDAPAAAEDNAIDETMHRRLLPGEGDVDVVGFVATLDRIGVDCPIHIEVFSDELQQLGLSEATQRLGRSLRGVLARARGG